MSQGPVYNYTCRYDFIQVFNSVSVYHAIYISVDQHMAILRQRNLDNVATRGKGGHQQTHAIIVHPPHMDLTGRFQHTTPLPHGRRIYRDIRV